MFPQKWHVCLAVGVVVLSSLSSKAEMPVGSWRLVDAGCSGQAYEPSPEEIAFVEAIKSEKIVDLFHVHSSSEGIYETQSHHRGASCVGKGPVGFSYPSQGEIQLEFGPMEWTTETSSDNISITCSSSERALEQYQLRFEGEQLHMFTKADSLCSEYIFFYSRVSTHK